MADMIKPRKKGRAKDTMRSSSSSTTRRTPLSSKQHSFDRRQQEGRAEWEKRRRERRESIKMGSVIGKRPAGFDKPKENKLLSDILKGMEGRKGQSSRARTRTSPTMTMTAMPGAKTRDVRSSNSKKKVFKTLSSRFEGDFQMRRENNRARSSSRDCI
mmetsp:Transcript_22513/g.48806  ORF Transcript_22513/g.48806 Transcript_22513/m.48806 type:complete len:158 (-) Transcript_22513:387-860(-)